MPLSQPGTVTLQGLSASGTPADCPSCTLLDEGISVFTLGIFGGCTCESPTTPSASGSFFTNPVGSVSDAAGNVLTDAGDAASNAANAAGNAAAKAAHAATLPVLVASLAIVALAFAAIHVSNRV
jgi:hypothetical protein